MSPVDRMRIAHRVANQAIAELVCYDNELTAADAARLISSRCMAVVKNADGSEAAAELAYQQGDALVATP